MKPNVLKLTALALLIGPITVPAASFTISLTENNLGDAGADWFGTFEAPASGGAVVAVSVVVNGVTYSFLPPIVPLQYLPSTGAGLEGLIVDSLALDTQVRGITFGLPGSWNFVGCSFSSGSGGSGCGGIPEAAGTYVIEPSSVAEPRSLMLLGLGLAGLVLGRRRRSN